MRIEDIQRAEEIMRTAVEQIVTDFDGRDDFAGVKITARFRSNGRGYDVVLDQDGDRIVQPQRAPR